MSQHLRLWIQSLLVSYYMLTRCRSGCSQCRDVGQECTWPAQRKRGPAKGYIEGLESRLRDTETLLLHILPSVPADRLEAITTSIRTHDISPSRAGPSSSPPAPPILNKKTGVDYWEQYPLDSLDNIRRWQQDCADGGSSHLGTACSSQEEMPSPEETKPTLYQHPYQTSATALPSGLGGSTQGGHDRASHLYAAGNPYVERSETEANRAEDWSQTTRVTQQPLQDTPQVYQGPIPPDASEEMMQSSFYRTDFQKQFFW